MASPTIQQIIAGFGAAIGTNSGLGGTIKVDLGETGTLLIDGKSVPNEVTDGTGKLGDATATLTVETLGKLLNGELDGAAAVSQGKLGIAGDGTLIVKLIPIFMQMRGG